MAASARSGLRSRVLATTAPASALWIAFCTPLEEIGSIAAAASPSRMASAEIKSSRQAGGRVDRLNRTCELRPAAVLHQARAGEKAQKTLRRESPGRPERLRIDEGQRVEDPVRQGNAPEPGLVAGLDPGRLGRPDGAPIGEDRKRRSAGSPSGRGPAAPARLGQKVRLERLGASVGVDREPPSPVRATALDEAGRLADVDAEGADLLDEGEIEQAAIDDEALLARILAPLRPLGPVDADPADASRPAAVDRRAEPGRLQQRLDPGSQRLAEPPAGKARLLDQADLMAELGHPGGEHRAGGARADDADLSHSPRSARGRPRRAAARASDRPRGNSAASRGYSRRPAGRACITS